MKRLYILTSEFPFGTREPFLEDELPYLAREFECIEIVPFDISNNNCRVLPPNVIVHDPIGASKNIWKYRLRGIFSLRCFFLVLKEMFSLKPFASKKTFVNYIKFCLQINNFSNSKQLRFLEKKLCKDDVVYSYWGVTTNILALIWRGKALFVSRFHGAWDLWEDSYDEYVPFRHQIVKSLKKAIFISRKGESYFKNKYPEADTVTMPLGSMDYGVSSIKRNSNTIHVVSCSTVYPLKRVDLLFKTLNSMTNYKIEWTHLGGGTDFNSLQLLVNNNLKSHLAVNLVGQVTHDEIMDYYKKHKFDVFVNLSTMEGVPVSIMEAISFDIPIVATDVGATSEVVSSDCGILISSNPSIEEISKAIIHVINSQFTPRKFWNVHYNAEKNYSRFAKLISTL